MDLILEQSRKNNPGLGITGILCFSEDLFIQVLEGVRDEVCELFNTIVRDQRHLIVRILTYEEIPERRFGGCTMGQVNITKIAPAFVGSSVSRRGGYHVQRIVIGPRIADNSILTK